MTGGGKSRRGSSGYDDMDDEPYDQSEMSASLNCPLSFVEQTYRRRRN